MILSWLVGSGFTFTANQEGLCMGTYLSMLLLCEHGPGVALVHAEQHLPYSVWTQLRGGTDLG